MPKKTRSNNDAVEKSNNANVTTSKSEVKESIQNIKASKSKELARNRKRPPQDVTQNRRIKKIRISSGLTQKQFSQKVGINIATLSQIENESMNVSNRIMNKVLEAFNMLSASLPKEDIKGNNEAPNEVAQINSDNSSIDSDEANKAAERVLTGNVLDKEPVPPSEHIEEESQETPTSKKDIGNFIFMSPDSKIEVLKKCVMNDIPLLDSKVACLKDKMYILCNKNSDESGLIEVLMSINNIIDNIDSICQ